MTQDFWPARTLSVSLGPPKQLEIDPVRLNNYRLSEHDADDRDSHSGQHHRQRPSDSSNRVVPLDQNCRAKCGYQGNGPSAGRGRFCDQPIEK
jgi:hypothetical protein